MDIIAVIVTAIRVLGSIAGIVRAYIAVMDYLHNKKDNHPGKG